MCLENRNFRFKCTRREKKKGERSKKTRLPVQSIASIDQVRGKTACVSVDLNRFESFKHRIDAKMIYSTRTIRFDYLLETGVKITRSMRVIHQKMETSSSLISRVSFR